MTRRLKQAGNLILLGLFIVFGVGAAQAASDEAAYKSARRARAEAESDEVDGVFIRLGDWFDKNFLSDEEASSPRRSAKKASSRKEAAEVDGEESQGATVEEDRGVIKAKRFGPPPSSAETEAKEEPLPPPYKIYPSPVILEDRPAYKDPYESAREQMPQTRGEAYPTPKTETYEPPRRETSPYPEPKIETYESPKIETLAQPPVAPPPREKAQIQPQPQFQPQSQERQTAQPPKSSEAFSGWGEKMARTVDISKPPPLPEYVKRGLASPSAGVPAVMPVQKSAGKGYDVPPISALPKQFFPVLPAGSLPDTPPQLLPVASNRELEADNGDVTRAIIIIHDIQRGSAEGVATLMTLSGMSSETALIVAPQFPLGIDVARFSAFLPDQGRNVARWSVESGWQNGGDSFLQASKVGVSSFSAVDLLLLFLSDRRRFPMMGQVVIAGHGMGGDFVQRYAAFGQAPDILEKEGIGVRFIVANPSSYLYFTASRPSEAGPSFLPPKESSCQGINDYPLGLNNLNSYGRRVGPNEARMRYPERKVVYLVGGKILSDNLLDRGCAANAQGADRTSRGRNYARYLTQTFGDALGTRHHFAFLPNAGYDPVSIFGSFCGMESLFGSGKCGD